MDSDLEYFVEKTLTANSREELGTVLIEDLKQEGYDNLVVASTKGRALQEVVWSELPPGYQPAYFENRWQAIDPVLHRAFESRRPFAWREVVDAGLSPEQSRFFGACRDLGVHTGVTVPLHGPGLQCDLVSVSARDPAIAPRERAGRLHAMASHAWFRLSELRDPTGLGAMPHLSPRETECLRWAKDGKSNWEIGHILSISERTVEFHLKSAMRKLGVNTRMLAVVVALQNALISL